jgi:hypothetical protein
MPRSVGRGRGAGGLGAGAAGGQVRSRRRREVGDTPDRWGPSVGEGKRGRGREVGCGFAGPEEKDGPTGG